MFSETPLRYSPQVPEACGSGGAMRTARAWETSLGAIESAVADCLKALDRYEVAFRTTYTDQGGVPEALRIHEPYDDGAEAWGEPLVAAERSAVEVEALLEEQEIVWRRWGELMARWRHSLEHPPEVPPESPHAVVRRNPPGRRAIESVRRG